MESADSWQVGCWYWERAESKVVPQFAGLTMAGFLLHSERKQKRKDSRKDVMCRCKALSLELRLWLWSQKQFWLNALQGGLSKRAQTLLFVLSLANVIRSKQKKRQSYLKCSWVITHWKGTSCFKRLWDPVGNTTHHRSNFLEKEKKEENWVQECCIFSYSHLDTRNFRLKHRDFNYTDSSVVVWITIWIWCLMADRPAFVSMGTWGNILTWMGICDPHYLCLQRLI